MIENTPQYLVCGILVQISYGFLRCVGCTLRVVIIEFLGLRPWNTREFDRVAQVPRSRDMAKFVLTTRSIILPLCACTQGNNSCFIHIAHAHWVLWSSVHNNHKHVMNTFIGDTATFCSKIVA